MLWWCYWAFNEVATVDSAIHTLNALQKHSSYPQIIVISLWAESSHDTFSFRHHVCSRWFYPQDLLLAPETASLHPFKNTFNYEEMSMETRLCWVAATMWHSTLMLNMSTTKTEFYFEFVAFLSQNQSQMDSSSFVSLACLGKHVVPTVSSLNSANAQIELWSGTLT